MRAARPSAIEPPLLRVAEDTCGPGVTVMPTAYASSMVPRGPVAAAVAAALLMLPLRAWGGGASVNGTTAQKPPSLATTQSFPSPKGETIGAMRGGLGAAHVVASAVTF